MFNTSLFFQRKRKATDVPFVYGFIFNVAHTTRCSTTTVQLYYICMDNYQVFLAVITAQTHGNFMMIMYFEFLPIFVDFCFILCSIFADNFLAIHGIFSLNISNKAIWHSVNEVHLFAFSILFLYVFSKQASCPFKPPL